MSACVACYELTGEVECLTLAKSAFAWLEEHAHDDTHGGYFVFYRREGTPIVTAEELPPGVSVDPIGTPIGYKDANTTSDLLKGFADLYRMWPDALLRTRLEELLYIMRDRLVVAPGVMHMYAHPDWVHCLTSSDMAISLRVANLLLAGSASLTGTVDPTTAQVAKSMLDTMLDVAWDSERGGFHSAGLSFAPSDIEGTKILVRTKSWWPQAEGLRALLALAQLYPTDPADYRAHHLRLWNYVRRYLIDTEHGGWFQAGLDESPEVRKSPKAFSWKDCSHETEALVTCLQLLNPRVIGVNDAVVEAFVLGHASVEPETLLEAFRQGLAHADRPWRVPHQRQDRLRQFPIVVVLENQARILIHHQLRQPVYGRGDDRALHSRGLQGHQRQPLETRGQ